MADSGVFVDWDGDGFGAAASDDDITGDLASWRITRGASAEITGGAQPGSCTLILNNPSDDRYNPLNSGGALYGKLRDGVPVWVGVNSDGAASGSAPRGLFGGRMVDVTPIPQAGGTRALQVEITCEDALGWLGRTDVQIAAALFRTHGALRAEVLTAADVTSTDLAHETATVTLSSWDGMALGALEEINKANGTRHSIVPGDTAGDWYTYRTRNRQWRLDATVDASVDAGTEHVTGSNGWRLSSDTVINRQKATVTPITWTSGATTVWEADTLPFTITSTTPSVTWVQFDDFVDEPVLDVNYTGTAPTTTLDSFGDTAKVSITTAGTTTITALSIEGRLARRGVAESFVADDTVSQAEARGVRAGPEIAGDLTGVMATARGMAEHVVWRYGNPQYRPTIVIENWAPTMFEIDLYDIIAVTITQLAMTDRLFEIVGLTHESSFAASATAHHHVLTLVLQECRVQSDPGWFVLDVSELDSADVLAY